MRILLITSDNCKAPSVGYRMRAALKRAGHSVFCFNYRSLQLHRFSIGRAIIARVLLRRAHSIHPDIAFILKGETIQSVTVQALKHQGIHTVCWTLDDPFGTDNPSNNIPAMPDYDTFFSFDSSYLPALKKINPHSHFLPLAVDPTLHAEQINLYQRREIYPISFYGSHYPNRQTFLEQLADVPITIMGFRWAQKTKNTPLHTHIIPSNLNSDRSMSDLKKVCTFFNQTKINLNIHYTHSVNSPNLRVFEIPATNSFQLCNDLPDLHTMFSPGKEIVLYKNAADCRKKIKYYLEHPKERQRIAEAGRKRVLKEHTFDHRMKTALQFILQDMKQRK